MSELKLKDVSDYVKTKIEVDNLDVNNYVTTDNLLQNKEGKTLAVSLPPNIESVIKYEENDILVSNIRPYLKKIWFATYTGGNSSDVLTFRVRKKFDPKFIYYNMFKDNFFTHMMNGSKGTKMPRGDKKQILDFLISNFDFPTQKKIAHVLSTLDKKIELNNRINEQLEAIAKLIYDYWFVQFDFPDDNGKPYKSSGGQMVYDEVLKREIPEGWEVGELQDIADIVMGQSPPSSSYNNTKEGTIFYQGSTDFGWRFPKTRQYTTEPKRFAKKHDILLSVRAPVGTLNIAKEDCCIGRGLSALRSKKGANTYLFGIMQDFKQIFDRRNSSGTTFGSITKDDLFSLKVIIPKATILKQFDDFTSFYDKQIFVNSEQNRNLSALRDWLLPMLMNGQVTVE